MCVWNDVLRKVWQERKCHAILPRDFNALAKASEEYHAFVIPRSRIVPKIRDLQTPVFDSIEPFLDRLVKFD